MKYKDFKMLSKDDMKQILGGDAPVGHGKLICTCGSMTTACGYSSLEGLANCFSMAQSACGSGVPVSCDVSYVS